VAFYCLAGKSSLVEAIDWVLSDFLSRSSKRQCQQSAELRSFSISAEEQMLVEVEIGHPKISHRSLIVRQWFSQNKLYRTCSLVDRDETRATKSTDIHGNESIQQVLSQFMVFTNSIERIVLKQSDSVIAHSAPLVLLKYLERVIGTDKIEQRSQIHLQNASETRRKQTNLLLAVGGTQEFLDLQQEVVDTITYLDTEMIQIEQATAEINSLSARRLMASTEQIDRRIATVNSEISGLEMQNSDIGTEKQRLTGISTGIEEVGKLRSHENKRLDGQCRSSKAKIRKYEAVELQLAVELKDQQKKLKGYQQLRTRLSDSMSTKADRTMDADLQQANTTIRAVQRRIMDLLHISGDIHDRRIDRLIKEFISIDLETRTSQETINNALKEITDRISALQTSLTNCEIAHEHETQRRDASRKQLQSIRQTYQEDHQRLQTVTVQIEQAQGELHKLHCRLRALQDHRSSKFTSQHMRRCSLLLSSNSNQRGIIGMLCDCFRPFDLAADGCALRTALGPALTNVIVARERRDALKVSKDCKRNQLNGLVIDIVSEIRLPKSETPLAVPNVRKAIDCVEIHETAATRAIYRRLGSWVVFQGTAAQAAKYLAGKRLGYNLVSQDGCIFSKDGEIKKSLRLQPKTAVDMTPWPSVRGLGNHESEIDADMQLQSVQSIHALIDGAADQLETLKTTQAEIIQHIILRENDIHQLENSLRATEVSVAAADSEVRTIKSKLAQSGDEEHSLTKHLQEEIEVGSTSKLTAVGNILGGCIQINDAESQNSLLDMISELTDQHILVETYRAQIK
jgi:chromosome segregation ATPase